MSTLHKLVLTELESKQIITDLSLLNLLPHSYKRIGHIAILNLPDELLPYKHEIGTSFLTQLQGNIKSIARFVKPISGITRKPTIEWLAGSKSFETTHKEINTTFILDATKIMLSSGNHNERKRIIEVVQTIKSDHFTIVDMFACVGNLSLPLSVNVPDIKVIGIEINPQAVAYLEKSVNSNKDSRQNFAIIAGDNRKVTPKQTADLVLMGYFGIDVEQLQVAIQALNTQKGMAWIMIHDIGNVNAESTVVQEFNKLISTNQDWAVRNIKKTVVKSIGPSFEHWVFDVELVNKK